MRYKARLVAGDHLTNPSTEQSYSGVVSLKSTRIDIFIGDINGHKAMVVDIGNAYLEAKTKKKYILLLDLNLDLLRGIQW